MQLLPGYALAAWNRISNAKEIHGGRGDVNDGTTLSADLPGFPWTELRGLAPGTRDAGIARRGSAP